MIRKRFLQGGGAMMALPFLESVSMAESKKRVPPLRTGIFTVTGGTVQESWVPKEAGKLNKLPSILKSLDPFKKDMVIISNLCHEGGKGKNGHNHCSNQHLTGDSVCKEINGTFAPTISIDQYIANNIEKDRLFQSLELGVANHEASFSYQADGTTVPYEKNPRLAFERMFKGRKPVVPKWNQELKKKVVKKAKAKKPLDNYERFVVDLTLADAKRLHKIVSKSDQMKLDQYIESVYTIEKRLTLFEQQVAEQETESLGKKTGQASSKIKLTLPTDPNYADVAMQKWSRDTESHEIYMNLFSDLMVIAFQTDTTRMCTLALGSDGAQFPGVVTVGYETHAHTLEHQGTARTPDLIAREGCRQIHEWYTTQFSKMISKMSAIDEGGKSLLDNCQILYTSYMAHGGHSRNNYPVLTMGNAKGSIQTGQHIACVEKTPMSNLFVEMAKRMGIECDAFGNSKASANAQYGGRIPNYT